MSPDLPRDAEADVPTTKPAERPDLTPDALALLGSNDADRVRAIRSGTWIPYPRANQAIAQLRYVLEQPPSSRMMGLTFAGPTNNGKTTIVREFIAAHRAQRADPSAERPEFLYVETPPVPHISMLYTQILRGVGDLKADKGTMSQKLARVLHILPQLRPRMLFLDEIHNVLAGSSKQSEAFLNTLKYLSNQLQLPVVLIGTEAALNVIRTDPQVLSRYPAFTLYPWAHDEKFAKLVTVVTSTLPLRRPAKLSQACLARLHARSHGALGAVVQILQRAAVWAIESGTEEINARALEATEVG